MHMWEGGREICRREIWKPGGCSLPLNFFVLTLSVPVFLGHGRHQFVSAFVETLTSNFVCNLLQVWAHDQICQLWVQEAPPPMAELLSSSQRCADVPLLRCRSCTGRARNLAGWLAGWLGGKGEKPSNHRGTRSLYQNIGRKNWKGDEARHASKSCWDWIPVVIRGHSKTRRNCKPNHDVFVPRKKQSSKSCSNLSPEPPRRFQEANMT